MRSPRRRRGATRDPCGRPPLRRCPRGWLLRPAPPRRLRPRASGRERAAPLRRRAAAPRRVVRRAPGRLMRPRGCAGVRRLPLCSAARVVFMATPKSLRLFFAHHTVEQYRASSLLAPAGPESSSDRQIKLNAHGVRISRDLQVVRTRRFVVSAATNFLCVFWRFRARGEAGAATYLARRWRLSLRRVYARAS